MEAAALIEKALEELLHIKRRWFALRAFQGELDLVSRGRSLWFKNDILWNTMLDSRDMLFIVIDDWVAARTDRKHGLFGRLVPHAGDLSRPAEGSARAEAFAACFPDAEEVPGAEDLENLRLRFQRVAEALRADRNQNRAHYFRTRLRAEPTAQMMDLAAVGEVLEALETILNEMLLVAADRTWSMHNVSSVSPQTTAADLVDLIVCRSSRDIHEAFGINAALSGDKSYAWQFRDAFYEALHAHATAKGWDQFNEDIFVVAPDRRARR